MPQRLIQLSIRETDPAELAAYCEPALIVAAHRNAFDEQRIQVSMVVDTEFSEAVMDRLQQMFGSSSDFQLVLLPLEATLPRQSAPPPDVARSAKKGASRISREELYQEINAGIRIRSTFVVMVVLSSIVAAIGLYRDDTVLLIGAMVIAPLLAPNIALSLSATLGDADLAARALRINSLGVAISMLIAILLGWVLQIEPGFPAISQRAQVSAADLLVALASGTAGALAFTTGLPGTLIGVMVAVALMPPLVAAGMLVGGGYLSAALGPLLLLATNVICLNLAAVSTFVFKGIRPRTWWEAERAKRATRRASLIWGIMFALLVTIVWWLGGPLL